MEKRYWNELNCSGCSHCCKFMTFTITLPIAGMTEDELIDFYSTRGCHLKKVSRDQIAITVETKCPYHTGKGCKLHGTKDKPKLCIDYDCRWDVFLPPGSKYNKEKKDGKVQRDNNKRSPA